MLPGILNDWKQRYEFLQGKYAKIAWYSIILVVWIFPYVCVSFPFWTFFEGDRTEWLEENGFEVSDLDWNMNSQKILRHYILPSILGLFILSVLVKTYLEGKKKNQWAIKCLLYKSYTLTFQSQTNNIFSQDMSSSFSNKDADDGHTKWEFVVCLSGRTWGMANFDKEERVTDNERIYFILYINYKQQKLQLQ